MKRTFTKEELMEGLGLPDPCKNDVVISDRIVEVEKWSAFHELIFRTKDQSPGEAWLVTYSVGATEDQPETAWEFTEAITATLVREVDRMVKVWEPVD